MSRPFADLVGRRFGRLMVVSYAEARRYSGGTVVRRWLCRCECGKEKVIDGTSLKSAVTVSCGCYGKEARAAANITHGGTNTPENSIWKDMKQRCSNANSRAFHNYGGRGIRVCKRWSESFESFLEDMGALPSPNHSIDRIDVNGDYEPGNCRWATPEEQAKNQRRNVVLELDGKSMIKSDWARTMGIHPATLDRRLRSGWSVRDALLTPIGVGRRSNADG